MSATTMMRWFLSSVLSLLYLPNITISAPTELIEEEG